MNIQNFFDKKLQIEQAQKEMKDIKQSLTQGFDDNFYFKINKNDTGTEDKLLSHLSISFFIPHINAEISETKKVTEILFLTSLIFNSEKAFQLTGFTGFKMTASEKELTQDKLMLMMYPELKITDLPFMDDSTYVINKRLNFNGMITMQKQHIAPQKFTDFCRSMMEQNPLIIKEINTNKNGREISYNLRPKEQDVIFNKFNYIFKNLMQSIDTQKQVFINLDNFEGLLKLNSEIENKRLHFSLNDSLDTKNIRSTKMKI